MSENTVKETKEKAKGKWITNFIWAAVGAIIGIVLGYAIFTAAFKDAATDAIKDMQTTESVSEVGDASEGISTYLFEHEVLNGDKLESVVSDIEDRILTIKGNNNYVQLQVGENEYEAYVYNKQGECLAQDSANNYSAAFRNDNKVVKYTSEDNALAIGTDIDILSIALNAINATRKNIDGISLFEMKTDAESSVKEYRVDLVGDLAVRECYTSLGINFADSMLASLKDQLENWEPHLIFVYLVDTNTSDISMYCYYIEDNTEYTNWVMQAYVEVDDWSLSEEWYTLDIANVEMEDFVAMLDNETAKISKLLDKLIVESEELSTETETEVTE